MNTEPTTHTIVYPEADGKPMADNTVQWEWMVKLVGELREQYVGQNMFIAGDLFWYPVEGDPKIVVAPDALVVFGRPPGHRGSYKQWLEDNIAPHVVFEILSPSNTTEEMDIKLEFYEQHNVQEYYVIDPHQNAVEGYIRRRNRLRNVKAMNGFVSPLLNIRFEEKDGQLAIYGPDGRAFQTREDRVREIAEELHKTSLAFEEERTHAIEEGQRADLEAKRANEEARRANEEALRANAEANRANAEASRADAEAKLAKVEATRAIAETTRANFLAAKLRELGINPDDLLRPTG